MVGGQPEASCAGEETLISAFCVPNNGTVVPEISGNGARCASPANVTIVCMRN